VYGPFLPTKLTNQCEKENSKKSFINPKRPSKVTITQNWRFGD
jgi:hypothetical protein